MSESVTIVGGGLAGLMLGIGLRQRGVPVTVWEAGRYPRHRACGEFISAGGHLLLDASSEGGGFHNPVLPESLCFCQVG
jgi:2-polyprenyl-6-methoxyphenol hydroxylase-like FAD-dependent oxidoreductase